MNESSLTPADLATIIAGVVALAVIAGYLRGLFIRTIGRRLDLARRLRRLGTGAQLDFFISVVGEPPAMRRAFTREVPNYRDFDGHGEPPRPQRTFRECFFVDPLYVLQVVVDEEESVQGFSVTTRNRRFHPTFFFPAPVSLRARISSRVLGHRLPALVVVELGRTAISEALQVPWGRPSVLAGLGARSWAYSEEHYLGNPGFYQTYVLTISSAAGRSVAGIEQIQNVEREDDPWLDLEDAPEDWRDAAPDWIRAVRENPVTTVTVISPAFPSDLWPGHGPHGDEIRTIPDAIS